MDGPQPGNTYNPGQTDSERPKTAEGTASDEIAQIDNAVQANPPETPSPAVIDNPAPSEPAEPAESTSGQSVNDAGAAVSNEITTQASTASEQEGSPGNESVPENIAANSADAAQSTEKPALLLSWQSGGDTSERGTEWYAAIFAATITLAGLTLYVTGSWMSAIVVVLAAVSLVVVNTKSPQVQAYGIFDAGVQIEERFYGYDQLRSFGLSDLNGETLIELEPSKRFYPRITMHTGDFIDQAQELLSQFLPKNDREPDMVDKISRRLKL